MGLSFSQAATVIVSDFIGNLLVLGIYFPFILGSAAIAAINAMVDLFYQGGKLIVTSIIDGITGEDQSQKFSAELAKVMNKSLKKGRETFDAGLEASGVKGAQAGINDFLLGTFGLTESEIARARMAGRNAGQATLNGFLESWGAGREEAGLHHFFPDADVETAKEAARQLKIEMDLLANARKQAETENATNLSKSGQAAEEYLDIVKDISRSFDNRRQALTSEALQIKLTEKEYQRYKDTIGSVRRIAEASDTLSIEQQTQLLELVRLRTSALEQYYETLEQAEEEAARLETVKGIVGDIGDAFGGFARDVLVNFKSIGEAAEALGRRIFAALIEALIIQPLVSGITAGLGSLFGVPGLQSGGFSGTGFRVVGEAGPELVDFRNPGRVYTNSELQSALSGSGAGYEINFSPVIQTQDSTAVRQALAEAYPIFETRTIQTIEGLISRPSNFRRSLGG